MAKATPKAPTGGSKAVSMNPDDFIGGGLPSDFAGRVIEARTEIWNYDNGDGPLTDDETGEPVFTMAVRVTIEADDKETYPEPIVQHYSAGNPQHFSPSLDSVNASPVDDAGLSEGVVFIPNGAKSALSNSSNFAHFCSALRDAQWKGKFDPDVRFLEGIYAHWERVGQKKRNGIVNPQTEGGYAKEILVPTKILTGAQMTQPVGKPPVARPAGAPPVKAQQSPIPAAANEEFDAKLGGIVLGALQASPGGVKKGSLAGMVMKAPNLTQPEKAKAVTRIASNDFLGGGMTNEWWLFDAETGVVTPYPAAE